MYLKINADKSVTYPYNLRRLKTDNPDVSFAAVIPDETLQEYGVYKVEPGTKPNDTASVRYVEIEPVQNDGEWVQAWEPQEISIEERRQGMSCSPVQFHLAVFHMGLSGSLEELMEAMPELKIYATYATRMERSFPAFDEFAHLIGKTPEDVDGLFELAATL